MTVTRMPKVYVRLSSLTIVCVFLVAAAFR